MKNKLYKYITFIIMIALLSGCSKKEINEVDNLYTDDEIIDKYNISKDYDLNNAEKDGFVIYNNNKVINKEKIKEFYDNTTSNQNSTLTIIRYTIEGTPIIIQYIYNDGKFIVYEDTTRDNQGEGDIIAREIKSIELIEENDSYKLIEKY